MSHNSRRRSFFAVACLVSLLLPSGSFAQQIRKSEDPTFFEILDVNVVNLEVFVTDQAGKFVRGLTKDDFIVLEDGKPAEITNFYTSEALETEPVPASSASSAEAAAAPAGLADDDVPIPEEQRLYFIIFIDNQNIVPTDRNRLIQGIEQFLAANPIRPQDRLLLVSYDGPGSLHVHQAPTHDMTAFNASLHQLARGSANGLNRSVDRRMMLAQLEHAIAPNDDEDRLMDAAEADARATYAGIRLYAQARYDETRRTMDALGQFVDSLGGVPGRKALLYVSGGVSLRPGEAMFNAWEDKYRDINRRERIGTPVQDGYTFDTTRLLEPLAHRANANRVTIYALGATEELAAVSASSPGSTVWTSAHESIESLNLVKSLHILTGPTGGFAAVDTPSAAPVLAQMSRDFESYYSLGYTPPPGRLGDDHKIEVKARDPRLRVRHRESHRDRTNDERMSDRTLSALLLGGGDNPLSVSVVFEDETKKGRDEYLVTMLVKFPMSSVVLLPRDEFHEGRVMVFLGARDGKGRTSSITQVALPIRVPNSQIFEALGQTVAYRTSLLLRRGEHTLAVGVRDEVGNIGSTVTAAYTTGEESAAGAGR